MMMVAPFFFMEPIISMISSIITGDKPSVGSSSKISLGVLIVALAIASICCCPPDKDHALSPFLIFKAGRSSKISSMR